MSSDDQREREDLLEALEAHRRFLRQTVSGVTDEQARQRTTVSELCLGGIIKHVSRVEQTWAEFIVKGPEVMRFDEHSMDNQAASFQMLEGESLAGLLDDYQAVAGRTDVPVGLGAGGRQGGGEYAGKFGPLRAAARNFCRFSARNGRPLPERSSSTNVTPPEVPTPGIAGGGKAMPMAPGILANSRFKWSLMAVYCSSGFRRLAHSSKAMKKKLL